MSRSIADLTEALASNAEMVCRHYLSNGRREGRYWMVGDLDNTPGRSLYVRLVGSGEGAAGKWTEHVAARDMLRPRVPALIRGAICRPAQHNVRTPRGIW